MAVLSFLIKTNINYYWGASYLLHFADRKFNTWQTGSFDYAFSPVTDQNEKRIELGVITEKYGGTLKNVRLIFLGLKSTIDEQKKP